MNILEKIVATKREEVERSKLAVSVEELKATPAFRRSCNSLSQNLLAEGASGIIAEFKQKSPSKGIINATAPVEEVTQGYVKAGASCLSVLTDREYFGGSISNLMKARAANPTIPILRKDFMIDPYQVLQAKAAGADLILLIAACLSKKQAKELAQLAKDLGMEVLMEIHNAEELELVNDYVDIVGVNNRNLKTFEVSLQTSIDMAPLIPDKFLKISESGLHSPADLQLLQTHGFRGFLIGETFMKTDNPAEACHNFIRELQQLPPNTSK